MIFNYRDKRSVFTSGITKSEEFLLAAGNNCSWSIKLWLVVVEYWTVIGQCKSETDGIPVVGSKYWEYNSQDLGLGNIRTNPPLRSNCAFVEAMMRCCSEVRFDLLILVLVEIFFLGLRFSAEWTLLRC